MQYNFLAISLLLYTLLGVGSFAKGQMAPEHYCQQFPQACQQAQELIHKHGTAWEEIAASYGLSAQQTHTLIALVWPELTRFAGGQHLLEQAWLHSSALQSLKQNISVGPFQLKHSFALALAQVGQKNGADYAQEWQQRDVQEQYHLLADPVQSFHWICMFYLAEQAKAKENTNLASLSCHYNQNMEASETEITVYKRQYQFPYGAHFEGRQYNYLELVQFYLSNYQYHDLP